MSDESYLIDKWIYDKLAADSTITTAVGTRLYESIAPQVSTPYPFIIFQELSPARDIRGVGTVRIMVESLYLIKVVTNGSSSSVKPIVDRIDTIFHGIQTTTAYVRIVACVRERTFRLTETRNEVIYRHRGSIYRIQAQVP